MRRKNRLTLEELESRLVPSGSAWGQSWPDPSHLTLSFARDGTNAGGAPSSLFSMLNSQGSTAAWETEILEALQTWAVNANVNIGVVADGGQPLGATGAVQGDPRFGDIRVASMPMPTTSIANTAPFSWSGTTWSGDMLFNSLSNLGINGKGQYDLYSVALHEAGHVFGLPDSATETQSAMYATYQGPLTGLSGTDIAALQALYGARPTTAAPDNSFTTATSLGTVLTQQSAQGTVNTSAETDYYKFSTPLTLPLLASVNIGVETEGLSLLEPRLSVYNAAHNLIGTATATSALNGDVSFTIKGLSLLSTYYFSVSGAPGSGVFGIGSYQTTVSYDLLPVLGYTGLTGVVNSVLNHVLQSPLTLSRAFGANTDQRFDYVHKATLTTSTQQDYYLVQAPNAPAGTTFTVHALAWELDVKGLSPVIHVYDSNDNPVSVTVLGNAAGMYSIQIPNAAPGASYTVEIAALNAKGSNATGNYELGVKFSASAPVVLAQLGGNTLAAATSTDSATLAMAQNGLFHFELAAANGSTSASAAVTMTIYDQNGNVVFSLQAQTGQPPVTGVVYLLTGTYTINYSVASTAGLFTPVTYWLLGEILSDPQGPYYTGTPPGSSGNAPTGFTYAGPTFNR